MTRAKRRKGKSGKGTPQERQIDIHLAPTVELIHKHLTEALCNEVFRDVRTTERQRKWSLFGLGRFWLDVVLEPPPSLSQVLERTRRGDPRGLLPEVAASPEAFFEKCKGFSSAFFTSSFMSMPGRLRHALAEVHVHQEMEQVEALVSAEVRLRQQ